MSICECLDTIYYWVVLTFNQMSKDMVQPKHRIGDLKRLYRFSLVGKTNVQQNKSHEIHIWVK